MRSVIPRNLGRFAFDPELTAHKIILVAGPRQAGKTTLAKEWLERNGSASLYYNWDDPRVRAAHREDPHFFEPAARRLRLKNPWIVLDEIHKATRWRDMLKGWFDVFGEEFRFLVTGSARLDLLRRGGDSLLGRYFLFHLFPFTYNEYMERPIPMDPPAWLGPSSGEFPSWESPRKESRTFGRYLARGPFPEPLLAASDRFTRRWREEYLTLVVRQEVRDITRIAQLDRIESLVSLLPSTVGSPLSYSSLGRDIEVAHTTVKTWMEALRRLYLVFPVPPYHKRIRRALRKERKWYFLDWSHVGRDWARLENLVGSCLWMACRTWRDAGYGSFELRYLRTIDKSELDFVLVRDEEPVLAVEVKLRETGVSSTLARRESYLGNGVPGIQVVGVPDIARKIGDGLWVVSADRFLSRLP